MLAIYAGHFYMYQQDGQNVIDIIFLLFTLDKGHTPENSPKTRFDSIK